MSLFVCFEMDVSRVFEKYVSFRNMTSIFPQKQQIYKKGHLQCFANNMDY